jgi:stress response protein YsnF
VISSDQVDQVLGRTAYDRDGQEVGTVGQVYLDDKTGEPSWATVNTGLFGTTETFVPVDDAQLTDDGLVVAHDKDRVANAPRFADDGHLAAEEEAELYEYYGLDYVLDDSAHYGRPDQATQPVADDGAMTRSEERLVVTGTEKVPTAKARLRKYIVTEEVTITVPVRKEKVVLETVEGSAPGSLPVSDAEAAAYDAAATAGAAEVIVHEEVPVVHTEVRATERVRVDTEEVIEEQVVSGEVRKERIIAEGDGVDGRENTGTAR